MDIAGSVTVCEPDPGWPGIFNNYRELIVQALGSQLIQMHHVGSTAIPGVAARPIIDILVEVISLDGVHSQHATWKRLKFEFAPSTWGIHHRLLVRKAPQDPIHIHIFEKGDPQVQQWLSLQHYLKNNPNVCMLYSRMKKTASMESKGNLIAYELAKQRFLQQAFVKSCSLWQAPEAPPKGLNRFMSTEKVAERIWDSFCLYNQTLFRYSPLCEPLPYPGLLAWQSKLSHGCFSPIWRFVLNEDNASLAFRFLSKIITQTNKNRVAWVSPFDPLKIIQSRLESLGFVPKSQIQFALLPVFKFQVYDTSPRSFKRILHSQEFYEWTTFLRDQTKISEWHDLYASLPLQTYAHGQAIEFYTLEESGKSVGSCALFFHRDSVGIMDLRWKNAEHLKDIVNMAVQRAHALNYPYIHACIEPSRLEPLTKIGFVPLFLTHQFNLERENKYF